MNLIRNRSAHPRLRDEEAAVIENAVRLAIDSIINVLYSVDGARSREYEGKVAERDKEIQRLEGRAKDLEREVHLLRRKGCLCGLYGGAPSLSDCSTGAQEPGGFQNEGPPGQECETSGSLGLFGRPPSQVSSHSQELVHPLSPSRPALQQSPAFLGLLDQRRNQPALPDNLTVKEEPSDIDTVLIKWEMSEQAFGKNQESLGTLCEDEDPHSIKRRLDNGETTRNFGETLYSDADRHGAHKDGQLFGNSKRSVPTSELPEEAQRLKRAAWRAASKRYYARKVARLRTRPAQIYPTKTGLLPQTANAPFLLPASEAERRRAMSALPGDTLQGETWRAASRRYYACKTSELQTDPAQPAQPFQGTETSGTSTDGDKCDGGGSGFGGIICS